MKYHIKSSRKLSDFSIFNLINVDIWVQNYIAVLLSIFPIYYNQNNNKYKYNKNVFNILICNLKN